MTLPELIACARRELALRKSAYPGWVRAGKMSPEKARHEVDAMTEIVATLEKVHSLNEVGLAWVVESSK